MTAIMNVLTDKENWQVDIFNDKVISNWHEEVSSMKLFSKKPWDWCLAELRDKAQLFEDTKMCSRSRYWLLHLEVRYQSFSRIVH